MAKRSTKKETNLVKILEKFDLDSFQEWLKDFNKPLWKVFQKENRATRMMCMCKHIINRTDMLGTEAHKKAVAWLKKHNTRGGIF